MFVTVLFQHPLSKVRARVYAGGGPQTLHLGRSSAFLSFRIDRARPLALSLEILVAAAAGQVEEEEEEAINLMPRHHKLGKNQENVQYSNIFDIRIWS